MPKENPRQSNFMSAVIDCVSDVARIVNVVFANDTRLFCAVINVSLPALSRTSHQQTPTMFQRGLPHSSTFVESFFITLTLFDNCELFANGFIFKASLKVYRQ